MKFELTSLKKEISFSFTVQRRNFIHEHQRKRFCGFIMRHTHWIGGMAEVDYKNMDITIKYVDGD